MSNAKSAWDELHLTWADVSLNIKWTSRSSHFSIEKKLHYDRQNFGEWQLLHQFRKNLESSFNFNNYLTSRMWTSILYIRLRGHEVAEMKVILIIILHIPIDSQKIYVKIFLYQNVRRSMVKLMSCSLEQLSFCSILQTNL